MKSRGSSALNVSLCCCIWSIRKLSTLSLFSMVFCTPKTSPGKYFSHGIKLTGPAPPMLSKTSSINFVQVTNCGSSCSKRSPNTREQITFPREVWNRLPMANVDSFVSVRHFRRTSISSITLTSELTLPNPKSLKVCSANRLCSFHDWPDALATPVWRKWHY